SSEQDLELLKLMAVPLIISQADSPAIGPADLVAIAAMLLIYEHYHPSITTIGLYDEVSRGFIDSMKKKKEYDSDESEHRKKTPSKEEKHEKGQKRKQRDKGGEKGDKNRPYRRK